MVSREARDGASATGSASVRPTMLAHSRGVGSHRSVGSGSATTEGSGSSVSKAALQREGIEYDRRAIRRKMIHRLKLRGKDYHEEVELLRGKRGDNSDDYDDGDDEESVYEDTEFFPWKQREAAVQAAALGGRTENRMEGYDSLERALQAHQHKLHYGRGKGFAWSMQQKKKTSSTLMALQSQRSMKQLTDWHSFKKLAEQQETENSERTDLGEDDDDDQPEMLRHVKDDKKRMKTHNRSAGLLNTVILLAAIGCVVGFAYYIEIVKIDTYEKYLPKDVTQTRATEGGGRTLSNAKHHQRLSEVRRGATSSGATGNPNIAIVAADDVNARNVRVDNTKAALPELGAVNVVVDLPLRRTKEEAVEVTTKFDWKDFLLKHTKSLDSVASQQALDWLSATSKTPTSVSDQELVERFALATLYFATYGKDWSLGMDALFLKPDRHVCDWHFQRGLGVTECNESKLVTKLVLSDNHLSSGLPKEIGLLNELRVLDVRSNKLEGSIPSDMSQLTKLESAHLEDNQLTGNLDALCSITTLMDLIAECGHGEIACTCCHYCCYDEKDGVHTCNQMDYHSGKTTKVKQS